MRLRSAARQHVTIGDLGLTVSFAAGRGDAHRDLGEVPPGRIEAELAAAGLETLQFWTDPDGDFGLTLAQSAWE